MGLIDFFRKGKEEPIKPRQPQAQTPQRPSPQVREYTVKSGDSLSKIAKQFYGNATAWNKIYQANRDKIKNPDLIYAGQKIIIP